MRDSKGRSPERIVLLSHMFKAPYRGVRSHAQASAVKENARAMPRSQAIWNTQASQGQILALC